MGKKWDDAKPAEKILALYSLLLFERSFDTAAEVLAETVGNLVKRYGKI